MVFLPYLVEFTRKACGPGVVSVGRLSCDLTVSRDWATQVISCRVSFVSVFSVNLSISSKLSNLLAWSYLWCTLISLRLSAGSVVKSRFDFWCRYFMFCALVSQMWSVYLSWWMFVSCTWKVFSVVAGVLFHKYSRVGLVDLAVCFVHVICIPAGLLSVLLLREVCLQLQLWICLFFFFPFYPLLLCVFWSLLLPMYTFGKVISLMNLSLYYYELFFIWYCTLSLKFTLCDINSATPVWFVFEYYVSQLFAFNLFVSLYLKWVYYTASAYVFYLFRQLLPVSGLRSHCPHVMT